MSRSYLFCEASRQCHDQVEEAGKDTDERDVLLDPTRQVRVGDWSEDGVDELEVPRA